MLKLFKENDYWIILKEQLLELFPLEMIMELFPKNDIKIIQREWLWNYFQKMMSKSFKENDKWWLNCSKEMIIESFFENDDDIILREQ